MTENEQQGQAMTENEQQIRMLVAHVFSFYGKEASKFIADAFYFALSKFDAARVEKVALEHISDPQKGQFMPRPADLIARLEGTSTDRATVAWLKAREAASDVGAYSSVEFDDPLIAGVIDAMGGWPKFCRLEQKDISYAGHEFGKHYEALARVGAGVEHPKFLRGECDSADVYQKFGLPAPDAVRITTGTTGLKNPVAIGHTGADTTLLAAK